MLQGPGRRRSTSTTATSPTSCATCSRTPTPSRSIFERGVRADGRRDPRRPADAAPLVVLEDGSDEPFDGARSRYEDALAAASPRSAASGRARADDLYILYTGGTTGMPKGVMWRQEDIFFAALGGGGFGQPADRDAGRARRAGDAPRTPRASSWSNAADDARRRPVGHRSSRSSAAARSCSDTDAPLRRRRGVAHRRRGAARTRSWSSATRWPGRSPRRSTAPGADYDTSSAGRHRLGRRDPVAGGQGPAARAAPERDGHRQLRCVGDRRQRHRVRHRQGPRPGRGSRWAST